MDTRQYLEREIAQLKHELSVTIPDEMQEALTSGDLRENSEYTHTLERQHFVGVRLQQLMRRLDSYNSIDTSSLPLDRIDIGSTVKVRNLTTGKIQYFQIVVGDIDDAEADKVEQITITSPIGQSLRHKQVKDEVVVQLPRGSVKYRILGIVTLHQKTP
jgi:transcription elongation factor GreA